MTTGRTAAPDAGDEPELTGRIERILDRHPAVGFAVGVLRGGRFEFAGRGHADLATAAPVRADTVFRIGSVTKTITAIAVMQLWEEGLVDLDAPVTEYLHAYPIIVRDVAWHTPTLRQLLTHTSGIPDARSILDLRHVTWGPWDSRPPIHSVPYGDPLPRLADHYRRGLEVVAEPGTAFAYSNPGFATLGQIVEDVSGIPLDRYLRERLFAPLGMPDSDLVRTDRLSARLASGYRCGRHGPSPVPDRDWIGAGGGGVYSTTRDLGRYATALLHGGENEHGRVLAPSTLSAMFDAHYVTDAALPSMGLAFFRTDVGGHRVVSHDGILPGFNAHLAVAPDDGVAVIALTNGASGAMRWLPAEMDGLMRDLLHVPVRDGSRHVPHHPEVWDQICGRYVLPPRIGDLRGRLAMGGGLEVLVRDAQLILRLRLPAPSLWRGLPLVPDDASDPMAFRVDLADFGMGAVRLRFRTDAATGRRAMHSDLGAQPISFVERGTDPAPTPVDRLSGEDKLMLAASRSWPQDIGALLVLDGATTLFDGDGRFRIDAVRDVIASRLRRVPRLHQVIRAPRRGRGGPYWADAPAFDIRRHVQELRLEAPVGEAQLLETVERLRAQRFERRHPLWRIHFITGLADGRVAMFMKLHHTVGDGLAAMTIVSTLLDQAPETLGTTPSRWFPRPPARPSQLVADNLRRRLATIGRSLRAAFTPWRGVARMVASWPASRELLAEAPGDRTSIDRVIGPGRRLALVRGGYRDVRRIARSHRASTNDVLLAITTAGLRRLLASRGEPVEGVTLRAYVPVTLRRRFRGPQQGTHIAQMAVPLSLSRAKPADRLARIAAETHGRKALPRPSIGSLFRGRFVTKLLLKLVVAQRVNLTTASIPGPRRRTAFAGAPVLEVFPVLPLIGNEPIGVGAVSYADTFGIGIAADRDAVPDLEVFTAGVRDELAALAESVVPRPSPPRTPALARTGD